VDSEPLNEPTGVRAADTITTLPLPFAAMLISFDEPHLPRPAIAACKSLPDYRASPPDVAMHKWCFAAPLDSARGA
jgi:hypothetical protein